MDFDEKVTLGTTGLQVGRLGIASSYRAPREAYEEAFERGCNYFTWGSFIKGRSSAMADAIKAIIAKGRRDELVLGMISYAHNAWLTEVFLRRGLKALGTDYADVLILGYYSRRPPRSVLDSAQKLKEQGIARSLGMTGHNRKVFPELARDEGSPIDLFHLRYNAVHRGAEDDLLPHLPDEGRPGTVAFTATCWGKLLNRKAMPPDEEPATAADCYRFVLSNPSVDVCMTGPKNIEQMRENLSVLDNGPMSDDELARMRRIGDHLYGR